MADKVSVSIAAKRLGLSPRRIRQLVASEKLQAERFGERGWLKVILPERKPAA